MAYNPFDDVIDQDPAYMANGGMTNKPYRAGPAYQERITKPAVQEDIARGSQTMANIARGPINFVGDVFAQTLGRLAENMVNPEAAERGRQKFAINKEIAKYYNTVPGAVTDAQNEMYFKRFGKEMQPLTFEEGINQSFDFILSDAIAGSKRIQSGEKFTDLDGAQQLGVALLPIEFWFGGAGARKGVMKGAEEFKKQYAGKQIAEVINDSKIAKEYPEIIAEMKSTYPMLVIGKGVDEGRIALMAEKGEGLPASGINFNIPDYGPMKAGYGTVAKKVDEKVMRIINENPEGVALQLGRKKLEKNYNIDRNAYKRSIERLEEANPNMDFSIHKLATTKRIDVIQETQRKKDLEKINKIKSEMNIAQKFKKDYTANDAAQAVGVNRKQIKKILDRNEESDLAIALGFDSVKRTKAERIKLLEDTLAANPNKKYTRPMLAEETGVPLQFVKDKRSFTTDAKNLVLQEDLQKEINDERIYEMNRLLEDINNGDIQGNLGPKYYDKKGYKAFTQDQLVGHPSYLVFPTEGTNLKLSVEPSALSNIVGQKARRPGQLIDHIENYVNLDFGPASTNRNIAKIRFREFYRSLSKESQDELVSIISDPDLFGFQPFKIIGKNGKPVPNPDYDVVQQRKNLDTLYETILAMTSPEDIQKIKSAQNLKKQINAYADDKFLKLLQENPAVRERFVSEVNRVDPKNKYKNDYMAMYKKYKNRFHGQISHEFSQRMLGTPAKQFKLAPGMEGKFGDPDSFRINFDNHNVALQPVTENATKQTIAKINKVQSREDLERLLGKLKTYQDNLSKRGMLEYIRFTDKQMTDETFNLLQKIFPEQVFKTTDEYGKTPAGIKTIMLGDPNKPDFQKLSSYLDERFAAFAKNPQELILSGARPDAAKVPDEMLATGDNPSIRKKFFTTKSFERGGPVRMAIGGDPLQNINQQQFTPDPAIDEDFFQQAVESENLLAFNPVKIFQKFGEVKAVDTPKKKIETDAPAGPPGSNLPTTQDVQPDDFAFKSFTLEKIVSPTAPKSARPQDWVNFLQGGDAAPLAELKDSGIEQYLRDFEKYFPNQKITQEQLVDYYETSPMGNLAIKVKEADPIPLSEGDSKMIQSAGQPRHRNVGNQPLDEVGKQYREIVVTAGRLPGETKPFVSSGHFSEENVIGFTRVADYDTSTGQKVAVIQELQTDMLTQVRKEQERVKALFARIEKIQEKANRLLQSTDEFDRRQGQQLLDSINNVVSEKQLKMLQDNPTLIKPFPNEAAKGLIPQYAEEIDILQNQIDAAVKLDLRARKPETQFVIKSIAEKQQQVLDNLLDLNRAGELDRDLAKVQVPGASQSEDIAGFGATDNAISQYSGGLKELEIFPAIPFNKQADYVDLLVKSTIKDAESKGIQKVAIMPAEKVNQRWGKNPDGPEGKKFKNLYDKVVKQQMQNIAKKYGATFQVEQIVDPTKAEKGLKFFNKNVDGEFELLKDFAPTNRRVDEFLDEEIERVARDFGPNDVVVRREIAPGQTMEYYVRTKPDGGFDLVTLRDIDKAEDAKIIIEETNPQLVDMFVLTMPDEAADKPFFLFKKKDGGSIAKDSLVSITDIFGEYGR